jgi:hypothetical protein
MPRTPKTLTNRRLLTKLRQLQVLAQLTHREAEMVLDNTGRGDYETFAVRLLEKVKKLRKAVARTVAEKGGVPS